MPSLPSQELASKEKTAFSNLFGLFHDKQYKKGIKLADTILAKNPDHGETLCMKALMLHHLSHENKDEAYELMKKGLTKNMTTHVCWHINGLIYRADKDYKEALKFYNQAHKRNEDDNNILRDLAHLQVHLRQLPPYIVSRHKIIIRSSQASQRLKASAQKHKPRQWGGSVIRTD
jgi:tetratricopeptide (TPR) repeat protein